MFIILLPNARTCISVQMFSNSNLSQLCYIGGEKEFIPLGTLVKLLRDIPFLMLGDANTPSSLGCYNYIIDSSIAGISNILLFAALGFFDPTLAPFLKEKVNYLANCISASFILVCSFLVQYL